MGAQVTRYPRTSKRFKRVSRFPDSILFLYQTLGQRAFAGSVTGVQETRVGLGVLDDELIVGTTLAGYDATSDNTVKLVGMARMVDAAAKLALGANGSR